jgi:hypothetical protein
MSTFNPPADIAQITLAKSSDVNAIKAATAIAFGLLPSETKLQRGTVNFAVDTGTANTYEVALDSSITSYTDGLQVVFRPINSNTGSATINLNGLGAKSIKLTDSGSIQAGDISAGAVIDVRYSVSTGFFHLTPNSAIYAHDAGVSATAAAASAVASAGSASDALTYKNAASSSASAALASQTAAGSSAVASAGSASDALTYKNAAASSAASAASSATDSLNSANAAAASYDSFDDRYLGAKSSDPTLDNDGNALLTGALYWNTASSEMRVYSGSTWAAAYLPAAGYLALSGGTMTGLLTTKELALTKTAPSISAGVLTLDCSLSNTFAVSLNAAITSFTVSNIPSSGSYYEFNLEFTADGTSRAVTWTFSSVAVKWPGGTAPTLTSTSGKKDTFVFYTYDAGTTWLGFVAGQNL